MKKLLLFIIFLFTISIAKPGDCAETTLRKFPYPYNAMLALSTDIDATSYREFCEIHRFLNTKETTIMGPGLGLDIANSFWMYVDTDRGGFIDECEYNYWQEQMSYFKGKDWNTPYYADEIRKFINCGWIDTMHSFGDFTRYYDSNTGFTRDHAVQAINELNNHNIKVKVWINHGNAYNIQNFGGNYGFTSYQQGDKPSASGYHTDLTIPYGIQFIWDSKGDSTLGYKASIIYPITLKDGQRVWGFKRFTHSITKGKTEWLWNLYKFGEQVSDANLQKISNGQMYSIIANHIGNDFLKYGFPEEAVAGFMRLKKYQDEGKILVTRTSRLLEYNRNHQFLDYFSVTNNNSQEIHINSVNDPVTGSFVPSIEQLRGFTFYVDDPNNTKIFIGGNAVPAEEITINNTDGYKQSVTIKWFTPDYIDYSNQYPICGNQ